MCRSSSPGGGVPAWGRGWQGVSWGRGRQGVSRESLLETFDARALRLRCRGCLSP